MADQGTQGLVSPLLRNARIRAAASWLRGDVLDIGCGTGLLSTNVSGSYFGYDIDAAAIETARAAYPQHRFSTTMPQGETFDTVVALALIEHLKEPDQAVAEWAKLLRGGGRIVMTTPHRAFRAIHDAGAKIGLFSADAADEHEEMFDRQGLHELAEKAGLRVVRYKRFLFGANQLIVLEKDGR